VGFYSAPSRPGARTRRPAPPCLLEVDQQLSEGARLRVTQRTRRSARRGRNLGGGGRGGVRRETPAAASRDPNTWDGPCPLASSRWLRLASRAVTRRSPASRCDRIAELAQSAELIQAVRRGTDGRGSAVRPAHVRRRRGPTHRRAESTARREAATDRGAAPPAMNAVAHRERAKAARHEASHAAPFLGG
jgi:hypothetical protein